MIKLFSIWTLFRCWLRNMASYVLLSDYQQLLSLYMQAHNRANLLKAEVEIYEHAIYLMAYDQTSKARAPMYKDGRLIQSSHPNLRALPEMTQLMCDKYIKLAKEKRWNS